MAKKVKITDQRKIRGIRRRWLINSVGVVLLVLVLALATFSAAIWSYYYSSTTSDLQRRAESTAGGFASYTRSQYWTNAQNAVQRFEEKTKLELQFLDTSGSVQYSSNDLAAGTTPDTPEIQEALTNQEVQVWIGSDPDTGERIATASAPIVYHGQTVAVVRYVTSLVNIDRQYVLAVALACLLGAVIFALVYFSNLYFVRSIVEPIASITETARLIADGSYGVQIEKKYDDEVGELTDTINDMSLKIKQSEKTQSEFISSVSHELRTPLTAIKGWAETMQGGGMDDETFDKGMSVIIRESERLSGIVEELLDFSRMQSGRMSLTMEKIDILAELGEAVYMFSDRARSENKFLLYDEPAMLSPVLGDINRLRQVFVNIIDNALKYTEEGGTISVAAQEEDGLIRVTITDNGCGIPAEHLPNVKKKFYKANQLVRGSGIGLAVADEIVRLHGGALEIESQEGVGTTVTISLPSCAHLEADPQLTDTPELLNFITGKDTPYV